MTRRGVLGLIGGGTLAAMLAGCLRRPSAKYRFKMTVEVETPGGFRTGSSVLEVRAWYESGLDPSGKVRGWDVNGEATAVDLPGGKLLVALLKPANGMHDNLAQMSMAALDHTYRNDWVESATRIAANQGLRSPAQVAQSDYPLLVTFTDPADPWTIERVDPAAFAVTRILVETTSEPVTKGIVARLRWLPNAYDLLCGTNFAPRGIPVGDFKRLFASEMR